MNDVFDPDDRPLTDEEAGSILRKKPATLAAWRSLGKGPRYVKDGRHVHYTPRFLKEYLAAHVQTPEPAAVRRQRRALAAEAAQSAT
jgi:hypothetical protein